MSLSTSSLYDSFLERKDMWRIQFKLISRSLGKIVILGRKGKLLSMLLTTGSSTNFARSCLQYKSMTSSLYVSMFSASYFFSKGLIRIIYLPFLYSHFSDIY